MTHTTVTAASVPVNGGHLFYESTTSGGPAIVLLHGGMLDLRMWDEQFTWLADTGARAIRYDARGHGRSSTVAGDFAPHDDLAALLAATGVPQAVLVGLSGGARIALDTALTHPDRVMGLALASPGISGREFTDPFVLDHLARQLDAIGAPDGAQIYVEHFLRMWVDGPHRRPDDVDAALRERMRAAAAANVARHAAGLGVGTLREAGAAGRLAEIGVPVLVLDGALDSTDILSNAELIASSVPGARHVRIPSAAHMINLERPALFDAELATFLKPMLR